MRTRPLAFTLVFSALLAAVPRLAAMVGAIAEEEQLQTGPPKPVVQDALWKEALAYIKIQAEQKQQPTISSDIVIPLLESKDITTIHQVAKHMLKNEATNPSTTTTVPTAVEILHALADDDKAPHVPSLVALGFYYAKQQSIELTHKALRYFQNAGNLGPHQAALYNAGRLHVDLHEYVHAMAYIREAARFPDTYPLLTRDEKLTETCREAYQLLSQQLVATQHYLFVTADLFIYGNLHHDLTVDQQEWWKNAIEAMSRLDEILMESSGEKHDVALMQVIISNLRLLWETSNSGPVDERLSPFQAYLLLQYMTHVLNLMTIQDEAFASASAGYEEALARSPFCYHDIATARSKDEYDYTEQLSSCFDGAASRSVVYYNRAGDTVSAQRVFDLAREHPTAATKWNRIDQTPRVYHTDDELFKTAQPFWDKNLSMFPTATALEKLYKTDKDAILAELKAVQNLPEGFQLSAAAESSSNNNVGEAEINSDGSVRTNNKSTDENGYGFLRIFNPHIGVRSDDKAQDLGGAGAWAEFGPLYDGRHMSKEKCRVVPTICKAIEMNDESLCIGKNELGSGTTTTAVDKNNEQAIVAQACGTGPEDKAIVVSIFRLRPGSRILPHVGTTNARLRLHFCLQGCRGVEITVGGVTVKNNDDDDGRSDRDAGAAIVFDDSFVNTIYNGGAEDAIFLQAVLAHPAGRTRKKE